MNFIDALSAYRLPSQPPSEAPQTAGMGSRSVHKKIYYSLVLSVSILVSLVVFALLPLIIAIGLIGGIACGIYYLSNRSLSSGSTTQQPFQSVPLVEVSS